MRLVVIGAGGVGGYFGARLAASGNDVTFVARGAHLEAMRRHGLRLDSEIGALNLAPVKVVASASAVTAADAVMFAVKLRDTESAAGSLRGLVGNGATVFTFQNGVESADRLGRVLGRHNIVAGAARINAQIAAPGVIRQGGSFAGLEFGEADNRPSPRTEALLAACTEAGIAATRSENISRSIWLKFAMLAPLAGLTALTRGPIGPVRANPDSRQLLAAAVSETIAVGMAEDAGLIAGDVAATMAAIDALPEGVMASMCHDLLAGKPLELAGLSGAIVRLGQRRKVPVPAHTFIAQALAPFAEGTQEVAPP